MKRRHRPRDFGPPPEPGVRADVICRIDLAETARVLPPEQLTAMLEGLGRVVAAAREPDSAEQPE